MSSLSCDHLKADLWRYIDRELPARRIAALSAHLRECDSCRALYEESSREVSQCRAALSDHRFGEEFVERFRGNFERELAGETVRVVSPGFRESRLASRLVALLLLVAVPALTYVTLIKLSPEAPVLGSYAIDTQANAMGVAKVSYTDLGGFRPVSLKQRAELRPGARFEVRADAVLLLDVVRTGERQRAARLRVVGPARFVVNEEATPERFLASLRAGEVQFDVEPRRENESFVVSTPDATTRVIGTSYRLKVLDARTRLEVDEGVVELRARGGSLGEEGVVRVTAGEVFAVRAGPPNPPRKVDPNAESSDSTGGESSGAEKSTGESAPEGAKTATSKAADPNGKSAGDEKPTVLRADGTPLELDPERVPPNLDGTVGRDEPAEDSEELPPEFDRSN
ncbi:MAG: FecR domain-containing protein [Planctomycetota bacterium]